MADGDGNDNINADLTGPATTLLPVCFFSTQWVSHLSTVWVLNKHFCFFFSLQMQKETEVLPWASGDKGKFKGSGDIFKTSELFLGSGDTFWSAFWIKIFWYIHDGFAGFYYSLSFLIEIHLGWRAPYLTNLSSVTVLTINCTISSCSFHRFVPRPGLRTEEEPWCPLGLLAAQELLKCKWLQLSRSSCWDHFCGTHQGLDMAPVPGDQQAMQCR